MGLLKTRGENNATWVIVCLRGVPSSVDYDRDMSFQVEF